jgi:histone deacetylase 6
MKTVPLQLKSWPATCGTTTSSKQANIGRLVRPKVPKLTPIHRPTEVTEIFFMGIGNAFYGVANLLINRGTAKIVLSSENG